MLSLSGTLRDELLELPLGPTRLAVVTARAAAAAAAVASSSSMEEEAPLQKKKRRPRLAVVVVAGAPPPPPASSTLMVKNKEEEAPPQKKRKPRLVAKAERLLFHQPESLLHRAVHAMFAHDVANGWATSMGVAEATRRFSIGRPAVRLLINQQQADPLAEGHAAALSFRVTVIGMLGIAMARQGGLVRIAASVERRANTSALGLAKLVGAANTAIHQHLRPALHEARAILEADAYARLGKQRLFDGYETLRQEVRLLRNLRRTFGTSTTTTTATTTAAARRLLMRSLSRAKTCAKRVEGAKHQFLLRAQASAAKRQRAGK
jgi:hypothetical protein